MPRDKTASHEKIVEAATKEFLAKGFEQASMKTIADEVGMTSAALYRHFDSKQAMFAALVQPALDAMNDWVDKHVDNSYSAVEDGKTSSLWDMDDSEYSDVGMVLEVMYRQPEAFRLLICCSAGTPYEGFVHQIVEENTERMMNFVQDCREKGYHPMDIRRDEMHMLVSAYTAALIQPIEHGYSKEDAREFLKTIYDFFTPGWKMVTGL